MTNGHVTCDMNARKGNEMALEYTWKRDDETKQEMAIRQKSKHELWQGNGKLGTFGPAAPAVSLLGNPVPKRKRHKQNVRENLARIQRATKLRKKKYKRSELDKKKYWLMIGSISDMAWFVLEKLRKAPNRTIKGGVELDCVEFHLSLRHLMHLKFITWSLPINANRGELIITLTPRGYRTSMRKFKGELD